MYRLTSTSTSTNEHVLRVIAKFLVGSCLWAIMSYSCNNHTFDTLPNKNTVTINYHRNLTFFLAWLITRPLTLSIASSLQLGKVNSSMWINHPTRCYFDSPACLLGHKIIIVSTDQRKNCEKGVHSKKKKMLINQIAQVRCARGTPHRTVHGRYVV